MVIHTKDINERLQNAGEFIKTGESRLNNQIEQTANSIIENGKTKPIILISGPSGSSKTTTAIKLAYNM